ncbi:MAG: ATP-binding domain-containing protein [Parabacteroides merdae]
MILCWLFFPKSGRILSRELIYTALTRARKKLILLIQDNISWLIEYTKPQMSVLAKRNTNLFFYICS